MKRTVFLAGCALFVSSVASAQVVINEVYYDAPGADGGQVFVELFGPAGFDISGWTIQAIEGVGGSAGQNNNESFTFPPGSLIPSDGLVVVADDDGSGSTLVPNADYIVGDMDLENGGDGVHLLDPTTAIIDAMAYGPTDIPIGEGTPCRDVFAPLSVERCPAGSDTDQNDVDFLPNVPTPGEAADCCSAIEWVDLGSGNSISYGAGESVGFDFWVSCAPNSTYYALFSCVDPSLVPPPPPFPVYDPACTLLGLRLIALPPFYNFTGTLGALGESVGQARLDFAGIPPIGLGGNVDLWFGVLVVGPNGFEATNSVQIIIEP